MSLNKTCIAIFLMFAVPAGWAQTQTAKLKADDTRSASKSADKRVANVPAVPAQNPEYVVGDGDVLHINVWQEAEVSQSVVVRPDGKVSLPLINEVQVSGMTPLQIQNMVANKLSAFVNEPKVTVTVTEIHSKRAFITGEVTRPGEYPLNTEITVLQLIAEAGGLTPFAKTGNIVVLRQVNGKQQRLKFHYKDVVHGRNTDQNVTVQSGDTVVVP